MTTSTQSSRSPALWRYQTWPAARFAGMALSCLCFLAGCTQGLTPTEKMMGATYPLFTNNSAATGFIVRYKPPHSRTSVPILFTTSHALKTIGNGPLLIGTHPPRLDGTALAPLIACMPSSTEAGKDFYVRHPALDIAAFPLEMPPEFEQIANVQSCLTRKSLAYPRQELKSGEEVAFLGFPSVLPGTNGAYAVLRSGRVASYPLTREASGGEFLINSDVYPGDSGAPVFIVRRHGSPRLAGMVIERVGTDPKSFSHLAIAVDAQAISEILDQFDKANASSTDEPRPAWNKK